jgi:predicted PurR-regulated permease PerM
MSILDQLQQLIITVDSSIEQASLTSITVAIHTMDEIFESVDPKKFAKSIDQLLSILQLMINDVVNILVTEKTMMLDFVLVVVQAFPKILKNHKYRISHIYKLAFELMTQTVAELEN